jgi:hypothetical protein
MFHWASPTRNDVTHIGTVECRSHVALSTLSLPSRQWRPVCARDEARYIRRNLLRISVWISSKNISAEPVFEIRDFTVPLEF